RLVEVGADVAAEAFDQGVLQAGGHVIGEGGGVRGGKLLVEQQGERLGGGQDRPGRGDGQRGGGPRPPGGGGGGRGGARGRPVSGIRVRSMGTPGLRAPTSP